MPARANRPLAGCDRRHGDDVVRVDRVSNAEQEAEQAEAEGGEHRTIYSGRFSPRAALLHDDSLPLVNTAECRGRPRAPIAEYRRSRSIPDGTQPPGDRGRRVRFVFRPCSSTAMGALASMVAIAD